METRKLYYEDSHCRRFEAAVVSCEGREGGYGVILDATAFYPEGGGQAGDTGTLNGIRVMDTREKAGQVVHLCEAPLEPGTRVEGVLDYPDRFLRMQQHSGEHMVSGIIHRRYGFHNTGFHMGADCITIDFDGVIPPENLPDIEAQVNGFVWQNLPVRCWVPGPEELETIPYRSKRALPWPVRIVEIPGVDICACCGTHVQATGEIGLVKLFSAIRFRGGTRMEMACGSRALEILNGAYEQNRLVSQAFSAKPEQTGAAAQRMNRLLEEERFRTVGLRRQIFDAAAAAYAGQGNVLRFEPDLDNTALRELADRIADVCGGGTAVFTPRQEGGFAFCLVSRTGDLRPLGRQLTQALHGRGGGKPGYQQGSVAAGEEEIRSFFAGLAPDWGI